MKTTIVINWGDVIGFLFFIFYLSLPIIPVFLLYKFPSIGAFAIAVIIVSLAVILAYKMGYKVAVKVAGSVTK